MLTILFLCLRKLHFRQIRDSSYLHCETNTFILLNSTILLDKISKTSFLSRLNVDHYFWVKFA
jgi:hypothetical protein